MRYCPDLNLPLSAYVPGQGSPKDRKVFHGWSLPEQGRFLTDNQWRENTSYLFGLDCFNAGFYWEAHEVWSEPFKNTRGLDDTQHLFFKALIQLSAAMLHLKNEKTLPARVTGGKAIEKLFSIAREKGYFFMGLDLERTQKNAVRVINAPYQQFPEIVLQL